MAEKEINNLISVLRKEKIYYSKLRDLAEKKGDTIVKNNVDVLKDLLEKDDNVIKNIKKLENEREDILSKLIVFYNFDKEKENISYNDLINIVPAELKDDLNQIRQELLIVIEKLQAFNEKNSLLIENAMTFNNFSFKLLLDNIDDNMTYNKNLGKKTNAKHFVDKKA